MKFLIGENGRNTKKSSPRLRSSSKKPIWDPSGGRRASNHLRHGATLYAFYINDAKFLQLNKIFYNGIIKNLLRQSL